jgi:hypothetical protein
MFKTKHRGNFHPLDWCQNKQKNVPLEWAQSYQNKHTEKLDEFYTDFQTSIYAYSFFQSSSD